MDETEGEPHYKRRLRECRAELVKDLIPNELYTELQAGRVLNEERTESIQVTQSIK